MQKQQYDIVNIWNPTSPSLQILQTNTQEIYVRIFCSIALTEGFYKHAGSITGKRKKRQPFSAGYIIKIN